jgi:hypothetical protein
VSISKSDAVVTLHGIHPISRMGNINFKQYPLKAMVSKDVVAAVGQTGSALRDAIQNNLVYKTGDPASQAKAGTGVTFNELMNSVIGSIRAAEKDIENTHDNNEIGKKVVEAMKRNNNVYYSVLDAFLNANLDAGGGKDDSLLFGDQHISNYAKGNIVMQICERMTGAEDILVVIMKYFTAIYLLQFTTSFFDENARLDRSEVYEAGLGLTPGGSPPGGNSITAKIENVSFGLAPRSQLPMNQVHIYDESRPHWMRALWEAQKAGGQGGSISSSQAASVWNKANIVSSYPPETPTKAGKPLFVKLPPFLDLAAKASKSLAGCTNTKKSTDTAICNGIANIKEVRDKMLIEDAKLQRKRATEFLATWAEGIYRNNSYKYTGTTVYVPYDETIEVGKIYSVYAEGEGGGFLFQGYLESLQHSLAISSDGLSGEAASSLSFTFVRRLTSDQELKIKAKVAELYTTPDDSELVEEVQTEETASTTTEEQTETVTEEPEVVSPNDARAREIEDRFNARRRAQGLPPKDFNSARTANGLPARDFGSDAVPLKS